VIAAVRVLEDDPVFNAGYGSVPNSDGDVECDAAIMNGRTLDLGGIAAVRRIRNPISVAAALLDESPTLLVADGAERFAAASGIALCDPAELVAPQHRAAGGDTVGCVALDRHGDVAAGTSTGGIAGVMPGRVGDSPLPGCGLLADNAVGGISVSGDGEKISRVTLATRAMQRIEAGDEPRVAAESALERLRRLDGEGGIIAIDRAGRIGWAHNSPDFAVAWADSATPVTTATRRRHDGHNGRTA
jgi:beta-aspartyl-peptidase (threonine type)